MAAFFVAKAVFIIIAILGLIVAEIKCNEKDNAKVPTLTARQKDKIKHMIETLLECSGIQGATLAVVNSKEVLMTEGFGFADVKENKPVTPKTLFPIASTSKGFTATLLAILLHENQDEEGNAKVAVALF